ncbi:MAG TPA: hypothetical protein VGX72_11390 [Solirubrobacteraceae bacterium]|jgi:hypothetical protein|nr:hypothetical protein [Solirubrobacteraceae bacterium]
MAFLIAILTLGLVGLVVLVVSAPLRRARVAERSTAGLDVRSAPGDVPAVPGGYTRDELDAAREAKYREIRDAELDFRTGKLSREDYQAIDADLRAEAIEILNRIERQADAPSGAANGSADAPAG